MNSPKFSKHWSGHQGTSFHHSHKTLSPVKHSSYQISMEVVLIIFIQDLTFTSFFRDISCKKLFGVTEKQRQLAYQALDNFQQLLHHHSNALISKKSTNDFKVRGTNKIPVVAVNAGICQIQCLKQENR